MNSLNKNMFFFIYPLNNILSLNDKVSEIKKPNSLDVSNLFLSRINTLHEITIALVIMILCLIVLVLVLLYLFVQKNYLLKSKFYECIINYINKNSYLKEGTKKWTIKKLKKIIEGVDKTNNLFMLFLIIFIIFGLFLVLRVLDSLLELTYFK